MATLRLLLIALLASLTATAAEENGNAASQLSQLLGGASEQPFPKVLEPRQFSFPEDHGPHPEYRNEWWYFTGNVEGEGGRRFGYELTFFRIALTPVTPVDDSNWRTRDVYMAHLAVTDVNSGQFLVAEKLSRGAVGLAGATALPLAVWIDDWRLADCGDFEPAWCISAAGDTFAIDLELTPVKQPVLNGDRGLSQKSAEPGNASYYYSVTRIDTAGQIRIEEDVVDVRGDSWFDREWGSSALADYQQGWDWFSLQLSDNSELMIYSIRHADGTVDENSAATLTDADGRARHLRFPEFRIEILDDWVNAAGSAYPSRWRIEIPDEQIDLQVVPVIPDQELVTVVRYWEGAVDVTGRRRGDVVDGRGYVELTGYAD